MIFKRNFTSSVITLFGQVSVFGGFLRRCAILVLFCGDLTQLKCLPLRSSRVRCHLGDG